MARAGGPGGGGDPGNAGGGSSGGSSGGGTGGNGRGNNTPGRNPRGNNTNSGVGPGNNTPGPRTGDNTRGNRIGGNDGRGDNTPGAPSNTGRRGTHAAGTTPQSRARSAMDRHTRERARNPGIGPEYSLTESLTEKAEEGAMSPSEMDMAIGMVEGRRDAGMAQAMGGAVSDGLGRLGQALGVPGAGMASKGLLGMASNVPDNPASKYGAARAESRMDNNMAQDAAEGIAGLTMGPMGNRVASAVNTSINHRSTQDIGRLGDAIGMGSGSAPANTSGSGGGSRGTPSAARNAMAPRSAPAQSFEWNPVDMNRYSKGLLSLAQRS